MSQACNLRRRGQYESDSGAGGQLNPESQAANDELQEIAALRKSIRECENRIEEHYEILEMANNELEDLALLREQMIEYQNRVEEQTKILSNHEAELLTLRDQNQVLEVILNELIDATPGIEEQFEQIMWILARKIYVGSLWGLKVTATIFFVIGLATVSYRCYQAFKEIITGARIIIIALLTLLVLYFICISFIWGF